MGRMLAFLTLILCCQSTCSADDLSDQITEAKATRLAAIKAADDGLVISFNNAVSAASTAGHADVAARVSSEQRKFEINGALPKSPEMDGALQGYLGERTVAINALAASYDAAIEECSKTLSNSRAAQLAGEKSRLIAQEAKTVAAKLGIKSQLQAVETPPQPTPDQTTHEFIVEFAGRVHNKIDEVAAEATKETRNTAHARMIQNFDSELRAKQLKLKLQINHVEDLTGRYRLWFDPREDSRSEAVQDGTGYFEAAMSSREAAAVKPGDYFEVSGRGRFVAVAANGVYSPGFAGPDARLMWAGIYSRFGLTSGTLYAAVIIHSDVAKYDYCIALDAFRWHIEHSDAPYSPPRMPAPPVVQTPPPAVQPPAPPHVPPPLAPQPDPVPPPQPVVQPIPPAAPIEPSPPEISIVGIPRAKHDYPRALDVSAPSYKIVKQVETQEMFETRNTRLQNRFGSAMRPSSARPDIEIGGNYCSAFWYSTLGWSAERRAAWLYHNSEIIRPELYQRETEDEAVAAAIDHLKNNRTKSNPLYVDPQYVSDPDLMFNSEYVDAVFHHNNKDIWSIPWTYLTIFISGAGVVVVWWASSYDGVDFEIPWSYVIVFAIGVLGCIFMALQ